MPSRSRAPSKSRTRASAHSARDDVLLVLRARRQKQAAQFLGVSERTIRRWKNEGVTPSLKNAPVLQKAALHERRVLSQPTRRRLNEYVKGKPTGKTYQSDWLSYQTEHLSPSDLFSLVKRVRGKKEREGYDELLAQFILMHVDERGKDIRSATPVFDLLTYTDLGIWEEIEASLKRYERARIVLFSILDA